MAQTIFDPNAPNPADEKQIENFKVAKNNYLDMINKKNEKMAAMANNVEADLEARRIEAEANASGAALLERARLKSQGIDPDAVGPGNQPVDDEGDGGQDGDDDQMITRLINGRQVTKSLSEWLDQAAKVEDADAYLRNAREYGAPTKTPQPQPQVEVDFTDEELTELANDIQLGDPEKAKNAIKRLTETAVKKATQNVDKKQAVVNERELAKEILTNFYTKNPDFQASKTLNEMFMAEDARLLQAGWKGSDNALENFELRLNQAGENVKNWGKALGSTAITNHKDDIKAKLTNLPAASGGSRTNQPKPIELTREENNALAAAGLFSGRANALMRARKK